MFNLPTYTVQYLYIYMYLHTVLYDKIISCVVYHNPDRYTKPVIHLATVVTSAPSHAQSHELDIYTLFE